MASVIPLLLYGLTVGISLGLTGGGGSIITVPLLVYLIGQPVHIAIPTSLVIVGGTAFAGYLSRRSTADTRCAVILGLVGLFGAIPGRYVAQFFSGHMLLLLFSLTMLIGSYFMFNSKTYEAGSRAPASWFAVTIAGIAVGFLTGLLGVGGGFLIVPALVLVLGIPMRAAIPTSLLVIAINCASSLVGQALVVGHTSSTIDWTVAALFLVGGLAGSWIGGAVAAKLNQRLLKRVFAVFVFAVGLFIAASTTGLIPISVK